MMPSVDDRVPQETRREVAAVPVRLKNHRVRNRLLRQLGASLEHDGITGASSSAWPLV
jgi:hypothetical protein